MINGLMDAAVKDRDYATQQFLTWFVKEQVEEEANASEIVAQVTMTGDVNGHLFWLDHHLGKRE